MSAGGSCYYPGERPLSSYAGGSIGLRSGPRTEEQYGGGGGGVRRSIYETERPITPCNEYIGGNYYPHNQPIPEPESPPRGGEGRFRRKMTALRDADGRRSSYASRSQSNDHMALLSRGAYMPDELEQIEPMSGNSRYATPEIGGSGGYSNQMPEYAYIAYHDSGMPNGINQQYNNRSSRRDQNNDLDTAPVRGILKNRQAYEVEPRGQGRLRRHQSVDKGYLNSHSLDEHQNNQDLYTNSRIGNSYSRRYGVRDYDYDINSNKKRGSAGLLNLGRRKTTEVRLGPESIPNSRKQSANILLEEEFKRPRSPIECIKSLFRGGNQKTTIKDNLNSNNLPSNYNSSRYSTNIGNGHYCGYSGGGGGGNNYKRYGGGIGRSDGGRFTQTNNYNGGNRNNAPNRWGYEDTHL
uniref:Uncharacterized protein n=1 Tax=Meloidogyne hapla TaxID=6305 RepID=A0A1I8AXI3_MELHA